MGVEMEVTAGVLEDMILLLSVLGFVRLARGEAGCEGGSWVGAVVVVVGGGVVSLVIVNYMIQLKSRNRRTDLL